MLDPVVTALERLQKDSANQDEFKKMAGAIRLVGECCLEGRPKKKRDTRAVWKSRQTEEEKAKRSA